MTTKHQKLSPEQKQRTVLITGCSDGGLGAALAIALHRTRGFHVLATARNPKRLSQVQAEGIETFTLDVLSQESISAAAQKISHLDILVNNAGGLYSMPISDMSITKAKELFDLNVWSLIAVTQAFLPQLKQSSGIIVNQTSTAGLLTIGFQSTYNASKAAMIMFTDCMPLELAPFGIKVVDLKTSSIRSNGFNNQASTGGAKLPPGSLFEIAREDVEKTMRGERFPVKVQAEDWAAQVTRELLKRDGPPSSIWGGTSSWVAWFVSIRPFAIPEAMLKKMAGIDLVERAIVASRS